MLIFGVGGFDVHPESLVISLIALNEVILMRGFFLNEGVTHWVGNRLVVVGVDVGDEVTLEGYFAVELVLRVGEAGSLFKAIPFFRALAVTIGPPSGFGAGLSVAGGSDLRCCSKSIRVGSWLTICTVDTWDKIALKLDFIVELILAIAEAGGLFEAIPLFRSLSISISPPLSFPLVKIIVISTNLSIGSETHWVSIGFTIVTIEVWNHVAILHLLVELFLGGTESSSLFGSVPFLGTLAIAMSPPLRSRAKLGLGGW